MFGKIRTMTIAISIALGASSMAHASCTDWGDGDSTCYDYQSGNRYTIHRDENGDMQMRGTNYSTGSTWKQSYDAETGRTRGTDSNGNYWSCSSSGNCY